MFARHTRTRMRPSTIAQGLKSWTSKLHPQLPLTNQESSRLLNALTSAFRQKLDEAHPRNTNDDPKQAISSNPKSHATSAFHSSAAHADKHLASVLTNPLLGGRVLDYGTAKVELTKNPHRDPIELLEEYHENGAASVPIAELCLDHFRQSVEHLPQDRQQASIFKTQAGRRVFKWLLENKLHECNSYVDNIAFIDHLVFFLVKEGREENIWSWVKLDIGNDDVPKTAQGSYKRIERKSKLYKYRWRGRILRAMLQAKLGAFDNNGRGPHPDQIHAALDTTFDICELKRSAARSDHVWWTPMGPISTLLETLFAKNLHRPRSEVDVVRFEKFYDYLSVICDSAPQLVLDLRRAKLRLIHPQGRQPAEAFICFQQLFAHSPSDEARYLLKSIRTTGTADAIHSWWMFATATTYALRQQGSLEEADWLKAQCVREFPRQERHFETKMEEYRRYDKSRGARLDHRVEETQDHTPIPFPTFA